MFIHLGFIFLTQELHCCVWLSESSGSLDFKREMLLGHTVGPGLDWIYSGLMTFVASQVQSLGWEGQALQDVASRTELNFWTDNMKNSI